MPSFVATARAVGSASPVNMTTFKPKLMQRLQCSRRAFFDRISDRENRGKLIVDRNEDDRRTLGLMWFRFGSASVNIRDALFV